MNLNQLKALDALEQTGSFSGAADRLGLTQPAVSIQLRKLQEQHGVKLFWRCGRHLEFSTLGKELVLKARKILGLIDDFEESLTSAGELRNGRLTIGLSCHYLVMELLAVFMERYPGIQVKAKIGDSVNLVEDVIACRLDLAEITGVVPDDRLVNLTYSDQSIVLFVSTDHPWARRPSIEVAELKGRQMVARHAGSMTRQIFNQRLNRRDIHPQVVMELDSWEAMKEAVAAGIGFGIALEDEYVHDPRLTGVRITGLDLSARQFVVCLPEYEHLRPIQAFFDVVREIKSDRSRRFSKTAANAFPQPVERLSSPACRTAGPLTP
ncbi:LysR substrate-binding domain-containing protein [uncultured Desulfosarcina sp.]|uniref:LysR substrate-binding domain-containing protein n=1 Tax=uncultured Desulfosarcina sp. TaxID=218289 RepID=UPI0029C85F86|nr:LysR substrate-binding domain-containing protein [uncultured Desulfosarcina sp.]